MQAVRHVQVAFLLLDSIAHPRDIGPLWLAAWRQQEVLCKASEIDLLCEIELSRAKAAGDLKASCAVAPSQAFRYLRRKLHL